jgi:pimeloyl-ACP methyl ester carboxylesterase
MAKKNAPPGGIVAWALGAAALGLGAGVAVERVLIGRGRTRTDAGPEVPYGKLTGDRRYDVSSFDGATLVADEFGPSDATAGAIFLHGFCLDRTIWHHQMTEFNAERKFIYYDARDHGHSRGGHAKADTKTLAADLKAVLDQSGLTDVVLVGHSLGGMTVLEFCREHEDELGNRVRGIVLANTTYTDAIKTLFAAGVLVPIDRRIRKLIERLLNDPRSSRALRLRGDDLSWILVKLFGFGPDAAPSQVDYTQRLLARFPTPPLVEIMSGLREFDMEDALDSITVPTLILAGGDDRITTVRASKKMAEDIPHSQLHVFEATGHLSMMERHAEFNALVGDFIDKAFSISGGSQLTGAPESDPWGAATPPEPPSA